MLTAAMIENPFPSPSPRAPRPEPGTEQRGGSVGYTLPLTPSLREIAERCVWFEPAERAVADPARFAAYVLTYGSTSDCEALWQYVPTDTDLRAILDAAPPGVFDARSWSYWNLIAGRDWRSCPPLPVRRLPGEEVGREEEDVGREDVDGTGG